MNASTVIALNQSIEPPNTNSFDFGITVVLQLVCPFVALRSKWACRKAFKIKSKSPLVNPEKNLTIRRSYVHFQRSLPSNADRNFAQLKPLAMRRITWDVFSANGKDVVKLYANGITTDFAAPVSNWLVLRFIFYGVLILQCFLRCFSIMCSSKELNVFLNLRSIKCVANL